jgi:hypothetical protein
MSGFCFFLRCVIGAPRSLTTVLLLTLVVLPALSSAEFLKTRPDIFQTVDERGKVIVSRQDPGIFIGYSRPINIQLFDPEQLQSQNTNHVFISFDPALNGYTKLTFGDKKTYRLIGSLTFIIGNFRVSIDNTHGYCSVTEINGSPESTGVLGFRGLEAIARYSGSAAIALLEAMQLESYQKVIKNFEYTEQGLTLNGTPIDASAVGISFEPPSNPCVPGKDKVFLNPRELDKIRKIMDVKERLGFLEKLLKQQRVSNPLDKLILIRITGDSAIGIDYERGVVTVVKPFNESKDNQICVMEDVGI